MKPVEIEKYDAMVVGAGLVGPLLAIMLKKKGYRVAIFERRADMRKQKLSEGRSINLVVTSRGLAALSRIGLEKKVLEITIPVKGRMMHSSKKELTYTPYGKNNECNYSISRGGLNRFLLDKMEEIGIPIYFSHKLIEVNNNRLIFDAGEKKSFEAERIFGADGAGSQVRKVLAVETKEEPLGVDYKELLMPALPSGGYPMEKNALHIWPRRTHMLMGLANLDGSFTMTLYLPQEGALSFSKIKTKNEIKDFFQNDFPDVVPLIPDFVDEFLNHPASSLGTIRSYPWASSNTCLVGDAAHAIVPFFGQGMNAGFEDCSCLFDLLNESDDWNDIFKRYDSIRRPNGNAIADMAVENYLEMRDRVGDKRFLFKKKLEQKLEESFPAYYKSRYRIVAYTLIPYLHAQNIGEIQKDILNELAEGIDSVEDLDLDKSETLITKKLAPYLKKHDIRF
ncbi:MAG: NAD(P)/FAD-dependent oxidoreductase [Halobacteriovoraceae bacterium]|nr:NAD(P)/FAD-dependent oxidoreductase [Halobacteriovoraceae bacterium]